VVRRVVDAVDPVEAFFAAHRAGELVGLPTSGTSGRARTVVRTTASWVDSFSAVTELAGLGRGARVWVPGPLSATMNLFAAVHAQAVGAVLVGRAADATHLQLTPSGLRRLLDEDAGLSGRTAVVAGDRLESTLRVSGEAAGLRIAHYYGAAELSFVGWGTDSVDLQPFPGVELDVRDAVIWVRSPFVAERVDGEPGQFNQDAAGFTTVGDRGQWRDGRLLVHGRDDAVVTGGVTVLLADVEAALRPGLVGQVTVVGLPHIQLGEVVAAVLTDHRDRQAARLAAARLGPARPLRWFVRDRLPLTPAGKVDRQTLARELVER
jgi:long-chain acyl-CoA synthetase